MVNMKDAAPLSWTHNQRTIYKLIQQGLKPGEIRKQASVSYSAISNVKNALAKGELPPPISEKPKKQKAAPEVIEVDTTSKAVKSESISQEANATPPQREDVAPSPAPAANPVTQTAPNITTLADSATILRVVPIALTIPLTPVMMNARAYCIQKLHWPENVRWEDMLDTIIVNYFRTMKIELAGWYEIEDKKEKVAPKTAGGNGNGNGEHPGNGKDPKGLAAHVIQQIIDLAKAGQL
jgi:hypothetical protein